MKTSEKNISADIMSDDISTVVQHLTKIVEEEAAAFQALLDALLIQQASIINGDSEQVQSTNVKVAEIMANTKKLESDRLGKSKLLGEHFDVDQDAAMNLSTLIPLVESKYAQRLEELKDMLTMLMEKIRDTNKRNAYLLDHSLEFVYGCMKILIAGKHQNSGYSQNGRHLDNPKSLYSGVG